MTCIRGPTFRVQLGFSLIEMMVTIIVLAIVMAIAFPNFTALINSNRLSAAANELSASLSPALLI